MPPVRTAPPVHLEGASRPRPDRLKGPTATRPAEGKCVHAEGVQAIIASRAVMGLPLGDLAKELPSIIALLVPLGDNTVAGGRAASVNDAPQPQIGRASVRERVCQYW